ncbi:MAG TPA: TIGR03621 family F420-dependent LLM class oxidoreductase [Candidatus Dormibacteraeota bacterium]|nr:TIGR03621 family F420-dependent LLM class oxidoreductase [Candidatus Dormibacteraeota bacterium]
MTQARPFRFGVQEHRAHSAQQWRDRARALESMGYAALYLPDHFSEQPGPIAALMAAADATTSLRIGSLVLDNDYRHPVVLAKEAATLDLLSDGRLDLGIGAGWMVSDYEQSGIPYDPAGTRIERLAEAVQILKKFFAGGEFSFEGKHYTIKGLQGAPPPVQKPHPRILLGGGGKRMLTLAAREGDIVHVNYNLREGRINPKLVQTGMAERTEEKLRWIKEAAGDRLDDFDLGFTVFFANITDDRDSLASTIAPSMGFQPRDVLDMPHFLIGTLDQIEHDLRQRRERYGFSHVILPGESADELAPIVERLAGQ